MPTIAPLVLITFNLTWSEIGTAYTFAISTYGWTVHSMFPAIAPEGVTSCYTIAADYFSKELSILLLPSPLVKDLHTENFLSTHLPGNTPSTLRRTPAATKFPSLRVYFQVNGWKGNSLDSGDGRRRMENSFQYQQSKWQHLTTLQKWSAAIMKQDAKPSGAIAGSMA